MARGGLCGINIYSRFLTEPDDLGAGQKEQLLRLIDRMLELGGEDVIAWGMDLDGGVTCDPSIGTPYGAAAYGEYLVEHGISPVLDALHSIFRSVVSRISSAHLKAMEFRGNFAVRPRASP